MWKGRPGVSPRAPHRRLNLLSFTLSLSTTIQSGVQITFHSNAKGLSLPFDMLRVKALSPGFTETQGRQGKTEPWKAAPSLPHNRPGCLQRHLKRNMECHFVSRYTTWLFTYPYIPAIGCCISRTRQWCILLTGNISPHAYFQEHIWPFTKLIT